MSHLIKRLRKGSALSPYRLWYNKWVADNAVDPVLDVGKSQYWDYGYPTIDTNKLLNPDFIGDVQCTLFKKEVFDTILCNGMYECVDSPQAMINEIERILKKGGKAIFGFVGKGYKPYKKDWKYFIGEETFFGEIERIDFSNEYHFIICRK